MRVLAIDQGTSATKALVVDDGGGVLGEAEVPVRVATPGDGVAEVEPDELWASVLSAGRKAVAHAGGAIDAVGLAHQGETVLAWDRHTGEPRSAAILWHDRRATEICRRLATDGWDRRLRELTGLELDPYFVGPKIVWLREAMAAVARGIVITTTDVWLLHQLCGGYATDAATASRTMLAGLETSAWNAEACSPFGVDPSSLPEIVDNATNLGDTTAFGTRAVPVTGACVDQQAALFAESCWAAGEAKCTYGTGAFLLATTGAAATRSMNGLVACIAWRLGGRPTWCLDGQVFSVGSALSWLRDIGVIAEPGDVDRLGAAVTDGGGATFVPGLAGLAAPFWEPHARGAFTGLTLATERGHLVRATLEGIAAQVAWLARAAGDDIGRPLQRLRVDGGLTRSHTLLQVQADLLQAPVEVYPSPHATAFGVGGFARLGVLGSVDPAAAFPPWSPAAVVEPRITADEADSRLTAWRAVAEATMHL